MGLMAWVSPSEETVDSRLSSEQGTPALVYEPFSDNRALIWEKNVGEN